MLARSIQTSRSNSDLILELAAVHGVVRELLGKLLLFQWYGGDVAVAGGISGGSVAVRAREAVWMRSEKQYELQPRRIS